ncbi:MAG: ATPase, T2SS/T4P/T4SS family [Thermoplasmatota archaeon]
MPETLVPDTSVLVDGRLTQLVRSGEHTGAKVLVGRQILADLEGQAARGLETGIAGLDELAALQQLAREGKVVVEIQAAVPGGTGDARDQAAAVDGLFVTSDRVQAHAAAAHGIRHQYLRPLVKEARDLTQLRLWAFFDAETMSVHLKADCRPMAKRGRPGAVSYQPIAEAPTGHAELRAIAKECIEFAKRDYDSFLEMEKHGCTVIQLGPMRITIAQRPFSDGLEITAVRPVTRLAFADYALPAEIQERIEGKSRGVFVAGPPGSGKSTFAAAVADHLAGLGRVVKTMEQPRDLQVPKEVTQYGALDRDMRWTADVVLLVRPDNVIYDEVRTTEDFLTFADMRLAGVGLIGVTHANRAIDAVQRLVGRVELGMIPQVIDTILFIDAGRLAKVLELEFTVKVPEGMTMEDLARPVVVVREVPSGRPAFELYTYGEQVVVMPLDGAPAQRNPEAALAERELTRALRRNVQGPLEVEVRGGRATVRVEEAQVPQLIGKGGRTVQMLERKLGVRLDIQALRAAPRAAEWTGPRGAELVPRVRLKATGTNVFLLVDDAEGGRTYRVTVGGASVGEAVASQEGRLRFRKDSAEGIALLAAQAKGLPIDAEAL